MSSEKIQLPDFLIADLYKGNLVDIAAIATTSTAVEKPVKDSNIRSTSISSIEVECLGDNKKNVAVIVNQSNSGHIENADLTFLTNVLKACNLTLPDIAIINIHNQPVDYKTLQGHLAPKYLLLFDVETTAVKLPFKTPAFQVQAFDGCSIMSAPPLSAMNQATTESTNLKRLLWTGLKKMFNIG